MKKITTMKDIEEKNRPKIQFYGGGMMPINRDDDVRKNLRRTISETDKILHRLDRKLNRKSKWYHKIIVWLILIAIATGLIWVIKFFILKII